jgi:quercetin 2,3-dioxygenase
MLDQRGRKMFLAGERGYAETAWVRRYSTFNFGNFLNEYKIPFGPLHVLNEEMLAGQKKFTLVTEEENCVILLHTVGAISYSDSQGNEMRVQAGEVLVCHIPKHTHFTIENPYETELVNYLQLWLKKPASINTKVQKISFDLDMHKTNWCHCFQVAWMRLANCFSRVL